jgi:hypothetical protein
VPGVEQLVFMTGMAFNLDGADWPRCPQLAAPGSWVVPVRQRHRHIHHPG